MLPPLATAWRSMHRIGNGRSTLVLPEAGEAAARQFGLVHRVLDVAVA